eukprot:6209868-Pleurochrysis_carterae.AAC.3
MAKLGNWERVCIIVADDYVLSKLVVPRGGTDTGHVKIAWPMPRAITGTSEHLSAAISHSSLSLGR